MKDTPSVRQQWLFDEGWTKASDCPEWAGRPLVEVEPLGYPRSLFDCSAPLVRKVSLTELEKELLDGNHGDTINKLSSDSYPNVLVLIDDRPHSANPIISAYRDATTRGIVAAISSRGIQCWMATKRYDLQDM